MTVLGAFSPGLLTACDSSGFHIDDYYDNGDGTFTVEMTIMVAGDITTDCGSTWGFFWTVDAPIISVSPGGLTSSNGTTINPVITGMTVTWGDPNGTWPTTPFVDAEPGSLTSDEHFQVTIILGGQGSQWNGGGQEAGGCPDFGCGAIASNYEGELPCLEPFITVAPVPPQCPGVPFTLTATPTPPYLTDMVTWEPGGLTGETITMTLSETTEVTITASNSCAEYTTTLIVEVIPLPTIFALTEDLEVCEGFPAILEVSPANEDLVVWDPGGSVGNVLIVTPTTSPTIYTATASNQCDEASVLIAVTTIPPPTVEITNDDELVCGGEEVELESVATNADQVEWLPGNISGETISVNPPVTTQYTVIASSSCGAAFDSVTVEVASTDTVQINLSACEGGSVMYNGIPLSAGSSNTFTFQNVAGCDSVVNVTVASLPVYETTLTLEACSGETVTYEGQQLSPGQTEEFTFTALNGCDSVVTVNVQELPTYTSSLALTTCEGTTITYQGQPLSPGQTEEFTFTALNGCDSVVTVSVNALPVYNQTVTLQTCTGTTIPYNGQNLAPGSTTVFNLTTLNGCDSTVTVTVEELANFSTSVQLEACTGTTVSFNGQQLAPGTVTTFNFTTASGCDSIVTVTVNEVAVIETQVQLSACTGTSVMYNNQPLQPGTTTEFTFTTSQGCDSVVTVTVEELVTYALPLTLQACTGTTIEYNGQTLSPGTTTDVTLTASNGCDSVVTVTVEELNDVTASLTLEACEGESVFFNGQQLDAGSVTDFQFTSSLGCDSILTVTVEEHPVYAGGVVLQACTGTMAIFNGVPLPPGTTVDFTLTTIHGCDSVIAVTVEEVETIETDLEFETCEGTFINYNGQQLPPGTQTDFTFTSQNGCDSIVTVTVELSDMLTGSEILEACSGTTVMYNGQALNPGTVTNFTLQTANGCDSVVAVTVVELETFASALSLEACTGSAVTYNGQQLMPGTVTDFTLTALNGCDSVVTVAVEELPVLTQSVTLQTCTGTTVTYNGQQLMPGTVTDFTFTTVQGCDSIVTVTVEEVPALAESITLRACTGSMVTYNGQQLMPGTVADFNFVSTQGCDSIVTVTVEELLPQTGTEQLAACEGELVAYHGQMLPAGSVTDVVLAAANGCDSVVTVTVEALAASSATVTLQGCEGETLLYNGQPVTPGTSMDFTFTNAAGCDSIVTVTTLAPIPIVETFDDLVICEGESAIIFGQVVSDAGTYSQTYTSAAGCDSVHYVTLEVLYDVAVSFQDSIVIGLGEAVVLQPIVTSGATLSFQWDEDPTLSCFDCPNPTASPLFTTTYYLTVSTDQGCESSANVQVAVRKERGIYIPNSFSPNGDGINDVFMVFTKPDIVANIRSFLVFSRWGETVYQFYNFPPNDPQYGWDGKYRGEEMNPAVFAFWVEVEFVDGVVQFYKGDVTLVK